jgi:hypothetical protein
MDFKIDIFKDRHEVKVLNKGNEILKFTDTLKENDLASFTRVIIDGKKVKTYIFNNGVSVLFTENRKVSFMKKIKPAKKVSLKSILTLDLETRTINGVHTPICMSIYDGRVAKSVLFKDPEKWEEDMCTAFKYLMKRKYSYSRVYIHNFSYFDGIFMMNALSRVGNVDPLMRDGKIIQMKVTFKKGVVKKGEAQPAQEITLIFYDSLLLLPSSLDNLSKSFNIENKKSFFPFQFLNNNNFTFSYKGSVPEYDNFPNAHTSKFTKGDYQNYCNKYINKKWVLENELKKYCENDTIALHQIIVLYAKEVFDLFQIDITKYPTLPSVTMSAYRTANIPKNRVPLILGKLHYTMKQGYYGGICDIYRPRGEEINSYDINSLYPYSMSKFAMPVGEPIKFVGDPRHYNKSPFGFFKVKVTAPLDMKVPFLPYKIMTPKGKRTICPVGS